MFEKIKNLQNHPYIKQLNDLRSWGMIVFAVIALMVTWSGIKAVQLNYGLQKQISRLQQENDVKKLQNNNQGLTNEYFNTDEYLELSARRNFGKAAPGETVLIVPKNVALAHTLNTSQQKTGDKLAKKPGSKPTYQYNFEQWVNFFLHRPTYGD